MLNRLFLVSLLIFAPSAFPHGGGLDSNGGHNNRQTGEYHCHRAPCTSVKSLVEKAQTEAVDEGRAFSSLYDRADWPHWVDADNDCQDTRAEVLIRDSQVPVKFKRNKGCSVSHGSWLDPYTGQLFDKASDLDIDHIVPLAWAHGHGAGGWTRAQKRAFANDMDNLLAVDAGANREKGAKGPDDWMPPAAAYRCEYLGRFKTLVAKYRLVFYPSESSAISQLATSCRNPH
ncbi:HNH endonuclease [Spongiibacter taiwanensis]|uniref:HNH endonuclease n=1 Tax=Spongiibacter taiwanensis TaxID=1748242 RepID=UPI0020358118|nr:HNH endonuclease [Spongiibacter taiwanensis]USA43347.1 HNH endonuclease [Spongiibacter taiwanensis]